VWQTTGGVETEAESKATPETVQHKPLNINILCTAVGMQQSALHILTTILQQLSTFFSFRILPYACAFYQQPSAIVKSHMDNRCLMCVKGALHSYEAIFQNNRN